MEFGLALPNFGPLAHPDTLSDLAREAEALGYDSLWTSDHVFLPAAERSFSPNFYDPLVVMALVAALTSRVRIGVSVLVLPYRDPIVTAKMIATLDQLARGRIILGVGVGWLESEFHALGLDFHQRGALTDEALDCMRALWTQDPTSFQGRCHAFLDMRLLPKPVQDPFPVWVGGNGPAALRRAAQRGTGWHPINLSLNDFRDGVTAYRRECIAVGRLVGPICYRSNPPSDRACDRRWPCTGSSAEIAQDLADYAQAGLTHILFHLDAATPDAFRSEMRRLITEVRPRFLG